MTANADQCVCSHSQLQREAEADGPVGLTDTRPASIDLRYLWLAEAIEANVKEVHCDANGFPVQ